MDMILVPHKTLEEMFFHLKAYLMYEEKINNRWLVEKVANNMAEILLNKEGEEE